MFISLQMPFTDLRSFIKNAPERIERLTFDPRVAFPNAYVRSFGKIKGRGYIPEFENQAKDINSSTIHYEHWEDLPNLWVDEFYYARSKNGLRFPGLEKHQLLDGKLINPRVKVRALHYSPYDSSQIEYSPAIRVETGIFYNVTDPLTGEEVENALRRFLIIPSKVPKYDHGNCADTNDKKSQFVEAPLIEQFSAISDLIVKATTAQSEIRVHPQMVPGAAPILTVHFFPDELKEDEQPSNTIWLPKKLTSGLRIGSFPLKARDSLISAWLFELPTGSKKSLSVRNKREIIRNYTITVMRYWSELQGFIAATRLLKDRQFGNAVEVGKDSKISHYINKSSHFLQQSNWHRANLSVIRNIANAYECKISKREIGIVRDGEDLLNEQIAKKSAEVLSGIGRPVAFLSYSHKDSHWQNIIQYVFAPLHKTGQFSYFDDNYIEAGTSWKKVIIDAIANAKVAILLISNNFLESKFINEVELPKIVYTFKKCMLEKIILVELEQFDQTLFSKFPLLEQIQFLNRHKPLTSMDKDQLGTTIQDLKKMVKKCLCEL